MSSSSEAGYRWSDDPADIGQAIAEDLSRIESAQAKIANRRRALEIIAARPLKQAVLIP
jgi:hypothetical protein